MDREEYYKARGDYRAALNAIYRKHGDNDRAHSLAFGRIYDATPSEIRHSMRQPRFSYDKMPRYMMPGSGWFNRCTYMPNSWPHKTKNP